MSDELERVSVDGKVHDAQRLKELQSLPLWRKIQITQTRIIEWYQYYEGKVYIAFSGGKDSTVLVNIARKIYPDIECVFVDTGLEYPAVRDFVKTIENVIWLKPKMNFKQVINEYGYPLINKRVALGLYYYRRGSKWAVNSFNGINHKTGEVCDFAKDRYERWNFLTQAPFKVSSKCCEVMKEKPLKEYAKNNGYKPITAIMTCESTRRRDGWLKTGCNAFDKQAPMSKPMSFWLEEDVLEYIDTYELTYPSVYGDIVKDKNGKYKTTGLARTGCMFCGFGVHLEKSPNRFEQMKENYPKIWDYCTRPIEENGLGMGAVLDYINVKWGKEENIKDK